MRLLLRFWTSEPRIQEIGTSMFATATLSQRHSARIDAQPAAPLAWVGAEPCLDTTGTRTNDRLGGHRALHCRMRNDSKNRFDGRGFRGVKVEVLKRRVPR